MTTEIIRDLESRFILPENRIRSTFQDNGKLSIPTELMDQIILNFTHKDIDDFNHHTRFLSRYTCDQYARTKWKTIEVTKDNIEMFMASIATAFSAKRKNSSKINLPNPFEEYNKLIILRHCPRPWETQKATNLREPSEAPVEKAKWYQGFEALKHMTGKEQQYKGTTTVNLHSDFFLSAGEMDGHYQYDITEDPTGQIDFWNLLNIRTLHLPPQLTTNNRFLRKNFFLWEFDEIMFSYTRQVFKAIDKATPFDNLVLHGCSFLHQLTCQSARKTTLYLTTNSVMRTTTGPNKLISSGDENDIHLVLKHLHERRKTSETSMILTGEGWDDIPRDSAGPDLSFKALIQQSKQNTKSKSISVEQGDPCPICTLLYD